MSSVNAVRCPIKNASEAVLLKSDTQLLRSFVADRRESAFEELMRRHGPMVMGVCRRVLPDTNDAEDAYQTTFLLLVQKSATIRRPERLAGWLFGVAYRVASRIRKRAGKQESLQIHPPEAASIEDTTVEVARRELRAVLDAELHCLPEAYRLPLILCYLEGRTHVEAARELGWPSGSMSSRLTRAREQLRRRLARRGLTLTSALLCMALREMTYGGVISPALAFQTTRAAVACASGKSLANVVSAPVVGLLADMNKSMFVAKARELAVLALVLLLLLGAAGQAVSAETKGLPLMSWIVQEGRSAIASLTRLSSASTDVRGADTAAAADASTCSCSEH